MRGCIAYRDLHVWVDNVGWVLSYRAIRSAWGFESMGGSSAVHAGLGLGNQVLTPQVES